MERWLPNFQKRYSKLPPQGLDLTPPNTGLAPPSIWDLKPTNENFKNLYKSSTQWSKYRYHNNNNVQKIDQRIQLKQQENVRGSSYRKITIDSQTQTV